MKSFESSLVKRRVQKALFDGIAPKNGEITGLAGDNYLEYEKLLQECLQPKLVRLIDYNYDIRDSKVEYGHIQYVKTTNIMDCDFCESIVNSGEKLLMVYKNMLKEQTDKRIKKTLIFTFSTRLSGGIIRTLQWLNTYLYKNTMYSIDRWIL